MIAMYKYVYHTVNFKSWAKMPTDAALPDIPRSWRAAVQPSVVFDASFKLKGIIYYEKS